MVLLPGCRPSSRPRAAGVGAYAPGMARPTSLRDLRSLLSWVPGLRERARVLELVRAADGSGAQIDRTHPQGGVPQVLAGQMLGAAAEHLFICHLLVEMGELTRYVHLTLLRTALEPAVTTRWLLAGDTSAARICRAVALLEDSAAEAAKITKSFRACHPDVSLTTAADEGMATTRAETDCYGTPGLPTRVDRVQGFALPQGTGEWVYRVLSSPAHGNVIGSSLGEFGDPQPSHVPGATTRTVRPKMALVVDTTSTVLETMEAAIVDLERYTGTKPPASG